MGLPGCWSEDKTEEEAQEDITAAVSDDLDIRDELFLDAEVREVEVALAGDALMKRCACRATA